MYIASDVVEMGAAHELVLSQTKEDFVHDDLAPQTMFIGEYFDE